MLRARLHDQALSAQPDHAGIHRAWTEGRAPRWEADEAPRHEIVTRCQPPAPVGYATPSSRGRRTGIPRRSDRQAPAERSLGCRSSSSSTRRSTCRGAHAAGGSHDHVSLQIFVTDLPYRASHARAGSVWLPFGRATPHAVWYRRLFDPDALIELAASPSSRERDIRT